SGGGGRNGGRLPRLGLIWWWWTISTRPRSATVTPRARAAGDAWGAGDTPCAAPRPWGACPAWACARRGGPASSTPAPRAGRGHPAGRRAGGGRGGGGGGGRPGGAAVGVHDLHAPAVGI